MPKMPERTSRQKEHSEAIKALSAKKAEIVAAYGTRSAELEHRLNHIIILAEEIVEKGKIALQPGLTMAFTGLENQYRDNESAAEAIAGFKKDVGEYLATAPKPLQ